MNTICITGRITREPEMKTTNTGKSVMNIDLAVKRPGVKDTTDFLTVVLWEKKAEYVHTYGHKGDMVEISGCLTTRKYQDRDGNNRTAYEILANNVSFCGSKKESDSQPAQPASGNLDAFTGRLQDNGVTFEEVVGDDDLPF